MLTAPIVAAGCGAPLARATQWLIPIQAACDKYAISTPLSVAAFLATIGVESGRLTLLHELWGPTAEQQLYEPPSAKAKALGNTDPGDGFKYRGRGCIQITGKANFAICGLALDLDLINHPELLEQPADAALSAAWYWHNRSLSALADDGNFLGVSRAVNLGSATSKAMPNGYSQRLALYGAAKKALNV